MKSAERDVVSKSYVHVKIHLLAMFSREKVESEQFILGNLNSSLIFNFIMQTVENWLRKNPKRRVRLTIVLDNSPMNHSWAIKNFCLIKKMKLLYTAPNSSFLNPIEQMFAKIKALFKQAFSMNKYVKKPRNDECSRKTIKSVQISNIMTWTATTLEIANWVCDKRDWSKTKRRQEEIKK